MLPDAYRPAPQPDARPRSQEQTRDPVPRAGRVWLTQAAYDKLQAELDNLRGPVREEIVARISAARDEGDLKENGGYHAAREEQGKNEAAIRQLEDMLERAEVGETPANDGVVEPGMVVTSGSPARRDDREVPPRRPRDEAGDSGSRSTPRSRPSAARSSAPRRATHVSFEAPNGKTLKVEVITPSPTPSALIAARRSRPR